MFYIWELKREVAQQLSGVKNVWIVLGVFLIFSAVVCFEADKDSPTVNRRIVELDAPMQGGRAEVFLLCGFPVSSVGALLL